MGIESDTSPGPESGSGQLAILGYHKIGEPPGGWWTWNYVPEVTFADHLCCLRDGGWTVIDHSSFLLALEAPATLPQRAALITFDDGYRSFLHSALPMLRRFGFPAVLFVPTGFIAGANDFDRDIEPAEDICDWDDLRAVSAAGIAVQSHGVSHRRFSELDASQMREELVRSKAVLEEGLGGSVETFSFPYGDDGRESIMTRDLLTGAGYRAACCYGGGLITFDGADRYRLSRLAMGPDTDLPALLRSSARHTAP
jgi:peptidoglycan/xylan/chitin deacetylase (PgdA/CDA1 family)